MQASTVRRWFLRAVLGVAGLLFAGVLVLQSAWGKGQLRDFAVRQLAASIDGELQVDRLEGPLFSSATLRGVRVTQQGVVVLAAERVSMEYRLGSLLSGDFTFGPIEIEALTLSAFERDAGWRIRGLAMPEAAAPDQAAARVTMPEIRLMRGDISVVPLAGPPRQLADVSLVASVGITSDVVTISAKELQARETTGGLVIRRLAGSLEIRDDRISVTGLELQFADGALLGQGSISFDATPNVTEGHVTSSGLLLAAFAPYLPALEGNIDPALRPAFDLAWAGPMNAVRVTGTLQSQAGDVTPDLVANLVDAVAVAGTAQVTRLNFAALTGDSELASRISGEAAFDLRLAETSAFAVTGTFDARLSEAQMFDYQASRLRARGRVDADVVVATVDGAAYGAASQFEVRWTASSSAATLDGRISGLDLRRLPARLGLPALETAVAGTYRVTSGPRDWTVRATLDDSTVEGAAVASGTIVTLESRGEQLSFAANGRAAALDTMRLAAKLDGASEWLRATPAVVTTAFDVSGTLGDDLRGHAVTFAVSGLEGVIDGARIDGMTGRGELTAGRLMMSAEGAVSGVWDRLLLLPDSDLRPEGRVSANIAIDDVTGEITAEAVRADGRLVLGPSRLMGYDVSAAAVNAQWSGGVATFTDSRATIAGGELAVSGDLAAVGEGASRLTFAYDAPDLALLEPLTGVAVTGSGRVEGTITGSAAQPAIKGRVRATQLAYDTTKATSVEGTFDFVVPEWNVDQARGAAQAKGLLVEIAGQAVDVATAGATVNGQEAQITVGLEQPDRQVRLAGHLTTEDNQQTFLVETAELESAGQLWRLEQGATARIRQTGDRVFVEGLRLVNGNQRLFAEGTIPAEGPPAPNDVLIIRADGVTMQSLLTMVTGDDRVHGRLDGEARVTGSLADPRVTGEFTITDGSADGVEFRSLAGMAEYRAGGATIDVRLDAGDAGTLTATGSVPVDDGSATGKNVPLNLQLTGQMSNIAILGPALPMIADLKGAVNLDVQVTGTIERPSAKGTANLTGVSFRAPALGVSYEALNASARFENSLMYVERFAIKDEDGHELSVSGSLDVLSSGASSAVDLRARATGFHVLNNEFGELVVNTDLTVAGDMRAPAVLGTVRIERGLFEVDRLLREYILARGYVPVGGAPPSVAAETAPAETATAAQPFTDSSISIEVTLPDNVVVRGRGIQTEEGTIGLGDINLTLGGQLRVSKAPGGDASLLGEVQAVRGTYDFQGRRFAIARGSELRFRGDDMTNPALDITAEREISGVAVTVHIRGTAAEPTLTLSSQPVLEEGDILALIAFGRPISQLGDSQKVSLAARAGTIAAGALATPLADSVARALDLDVFEIQTAGGVGAGTSVLVGRQLNDKLFVGFRHQFGQDGGQQLTFEYRLTQFLRVVSTIAPGGDAATLSARSAGSGIDLIVVIRR